MNITPTMKQALVEHVERYQIIKQELPSNNLPVNFDGRKEWPGCIHGVLDQGDCGSCWAFAATEVLSDRLCIHSSGSINVTLSPQNLLSCEDENLGCLLGSLPEFAWHYLMDYGVTTLECVPYESEDGSVPSCTGDTCQDGSIGKLYQAYNYSQVGDFIEPSHHIEEIMKALLQGPVDSTFMVFSDFEDYNGGVYQHESGMFLGLHSVKVIGYGVENGTDYWLVQNSWGKEWGLDGFFKIIRGINDCLFETLMYTGWPLI